MTARRSGVRIPVDPVKQAYLDSDLTASEVCRRLGWVSDAPGYVCGKTSNLARMLGLASSRNVIRGKTYVNTNTTILQSHAQEICAVLDVDFDELYDGLLPEVKPRGGKCVTCGEWMLRPDPYGMCGFCHWEIAEFGEPAVGVTERKSIARAA
jgi:hypothetical protein